MIPLPQRLRGPDRSIAPLPAPEPSTGPFRWGRSHQPLTTHLIASADRGRRSTPATPKTAIIGTEMESSPPGRITPTALLAQRPQPRKSTRGCACRSPLPPRRLPGGFHLGARPPHPDGFGARPVLPVRHALLKARPHSGPVDPRLWRCRIIAAHNCAEALHPRPEQCCQPDHAFFAPRGIRRFYVIFPKKIRAKSKWRPHCRGRHRKIFWPVCLRRLQR